jgi:hypothetical protein
MNALCFLQGAFFVNRTMNYQSDIAYSWIFVIDATLFHNLI